MEGLGLVLVFTAVWLWYFRKESRFPQALLLVPCALGCVWLLNIVRICAIVLIGGLAGSVAISACGGSSQPKTPPGTSTVSVMATGSGNTSQSIMITLTVAQ